MDLKYRLQRKSVQPQLSKNSLNKYKKVNKSDKNQNYNKEASSQTLKKQCKKYFVDANNVYYEDRESLRNIRQIKNILMTLVIIWFFLAGSYFFISKIQKYDGKCPKNADCNVYIRCHPGYQLSQDQTKCVILKRIIQNIENVCKFQIQKLRYQYGKAQCNQQDQNDFLNSKRIQDLKQELTKDIELKQISEQIKMKIDQFLKKQQNQKQYKFKIEEDRLIKPSEKLFTWLCYIKVSSRTLQFKIYLALSVLGLILAFYIFRYIDKSNKASKIYSYLKQKVLAQQKINISLLGDEMINIFGKIDQNLWTSVDQLRKKDKKIGYYQDQYLYWKAF